MKYKIINIKKRSVLEELFSFSIDQWNVTVRFEDGKRKTISIYQRHLTNDHDLNRFRKYVRQKLSFGNQFAQGQSNHQKLIGEEGETI